MHRCRRHLPFPGLFLAILLPALSVEADMGSLPLKKSARIFEPKQDAIVAWNGRREILYLQTTLRASEATKVIEVMPLPSRPVVETVDRGIFRRMTFFLPRPEEGRKEAGNPFGTAEPEEPAGEIVERKQIGAHDLATVQVKDVDGFTRWVETQFSGRGGPEGPEIPDALRKVIEEYLDDGFSWFLFDTIDLGADLSEKVPLRIQFESDRLYYPMRITRVESGETEVNLSVITDVLFEAEDLVGIDREDLEVSGRPRSHPAAKLSAVDAAISSLFAAGTEVKVRHWTIRGSLDSFSADLLVTHPDLRRREAGGTSE